MDTLACEQLQGRYVRLEQLAERHREPLRSAAADPAIWSLMAVCAAGPGFDPWFDAALAQQSDRHAVVFSVFECATSQWIGSTRYHDIVPAHRRLEIGGTWYVPRVWRTAVNTECKWLLLNHAFEAWGAHRVQLLTEVINERSQAAIAALGAHFEGILRSHMISQGGRIRDSALYSITSADWPQVRTGLQQRLLRQGTQRA